jgi:hypothetical protein
LLVIAILVAAGGAMAGPVRGRLSGQEKLIPQVYVDAAKLDAHRYTWREPSPTVKNEFRVLSGNPQREICIAALAGQAQPPREPYLVKITGGRTHLTTVAAPPSTRIAFKNVDPFPHRLYTFGSQLWKPETIAPGAQREFSAPNGAGRFEFRDELFPSLRTFVVVEPNIADVTFPNRDGSFELSLGAGEYTLVAYFNGKEAGKFGVVVKGDGRPLVLKDPFNLSLMPGGQQ